MSNEPDDTTIGRGGWTLVIASGVISFLVLHLLFNYHLFPSLAFALAIALVVLLILYRLAAAVNRYDDAEAERHVRKIVPASEVSDGTTRVSGIEGAQSSTVVAVPVRPEPAASPTMRPAAVVTPLSRVEAAPILPPQPLAPAAAPPSSVAPEPDADDFGLPDVWARPAATPRATLAAKAAAEAKAATEAKAAPVAKVAPDVPAKPKAKAADKPKVGFKTKADLEAEASMKTKSGAAKPKAAAETDPKPDAKSAPKTKVAVKAEPKADAKAKSAAKATADAKPKAAAKPKVAKPKAEKPVVAGLVRLTAPRGGVADDLKEIEGIGPAIEKLVNGMGFYHFDQIAAWTDADVATVDAELRTFKGRIARDKWVAQARIIVKEGLIAFRERAKTNDY
jgi:predicted flap endonuclease-1-like 5' DNA nuclease